MNFFTGNMKDDNGSLVFEEGSFTVAVGPKHSEILKPYVGKEIIMGVRPEDLNYTPKPAKVNSMKTRIEVVEPLGAEIHLYVGTEKHSFITRCPPNFEFNVGDDAYFEPTLEKTVSTTSILTFASLTAFHVDRV